jgi:hypothetical protein
MKIPPRPCPENASALLIVMVLGAVALLILASTMAWTSTTARIADSSVRHSVAVAAAEAATEKVIADLTTDFAKQGAATVSANLPNYRVHIPNGSENAHWNRYKFSNGKGGNDAVSLEQTAPWANGTPLISQYQGLKGYAATYRIKANATDLAGSHQVIGAVQEDVQLALIPIFQFAIFYNMDLEINPGAAMTIGGRTHANANIYLQPAAPLTFNGDVTGSGDIIPDKKPGDPTVRSGQTPAFSGEHDGGVMTLNLPIGTDNSPDAVRQIVEIPPNNESVNSDLGRQRFYNNADLVIVVSDSGVSVRGGGIANGNGPNLKWASVSNFVNLNKSFYDARENKTIKLVELDVAGLVAWNADSKNALKNALKRDVNSVYIADQRTQSAITEPGVRLINGATLPPLGLTVATPDPLYVQGNFNASGGALGSSDTSSTKPAALIGDSINVLSASWSDANSVKSLSLRTAANTTVNAAFMAGIVETGNGYYSGGVENFPRFLENWSGRTFTYNGSMIVLYYSQHATGPWRGTGNLYNIYNPPNRNWYFDHNFLDPNKLPPLCPSVRAVIRGRWTTIAPNT